MDVSLPLALLGGLSPQRFMQRHWQKKPLLVRQAVPGLQPLLDRSELFGLASRDGVQSRLIIQDGERWRLRNGPFARRALPALTQRQWTLLVQGVDLHDDRAHDLLSRFRFVPDARLDDLMISFATDGGGVGPHFDSYDVFLLQVHGRRRWRIGRQKDLSLRDDLPLKILEHFEPEEEWLLEPGDMLYLPPRWAHDGIAEGECMTCSIGFRAPAQGELARELLQRIADDIEAPALYRDPSQPATDRPAQLPADLTAFAADAVRAEVERALKGDALALALGEYLTEPKADTWFDENDGAELAAGRGLRLDRRTRAAYDARHVFINGEGLRAGGRDAKLMQRLADARGLSARELAGASDAARDLLADWLHAGWLHGAD